MRVNILNFFPHFVNVRLDVPGPGCGLATYPLAPIPQSYPLLLLLLLLLLVLPLLQLLLLLLLLFLLLLLLPLQTFRCGPTTTPRRGS